MTSSRWQHRSFGFQSLSQEDKLATIHRQDTTVRIPEPGGEAGPQTEKDYNRRVTGVATLLAHGPSLRSGRTLHQADHPQPPPGAYCFSSGKKRDPKRDITSPSTAGCFPGGLFKSNLMGITGEIAAFGGSDRDREGGRAYSNQCLDLGSLPSCLQSFNYWAVL